MRVYARCKGRERRVFPLAGGYGQFDLEDISAELETEWVFTKATESGGAFYGR